MKIKLLKDGLVEPYSWPKKAGDIVDINPRDVSQNIDSGLAELYHLTDEANALKADIEDEPEPDDLSSRPED